MEFFLAIIGLLVIISLVYWAQEALNKRRQKKLDGIAYDTLAGLDFNKEKEEIKSFGSRYVSKEYRCPRCNGILVMRNGRYGKFWGCNHWPECEYTRNI